MPESPPDCGESPNEGVYLIDLDRPSVRTPITIFDDTSGRLSRRSSTPFPTPGLGSPPPRSHAPAERCVRQEIEFNPPISGGARQFAGRTNSNCGLGSRGKIGTKGETGGWSDPASNTVA
jgi:hypothetical protein